MRLFRKNKKITWDQLTNVKWAQVLESKVIENNLYIDAKFSYKLDELNLLLWQREYKIGFKETLNMFEDEFVQIARLAYQQNDESGSLKDEINSLYNSKWIE